MSVINKIKIDDVVYDIEDASLKDTVDNLKMSYSGSATYLSGSLGKAVQDANAAITNLSNDVEDFKDPFIVTVTMTSEDAGYTNKTIAEILTAYNDGKTVRLEGTLGDVSFSVPVGTIYESSGNYAIQSYAVQINDPVVLITLLMPWGYNSTSFTLVTTPFETDLSSYRTAADQDTIDAEIIGNVENINSNIKEIPIQFTNDGSGGVSYTTGNLFTTNSMSHTDYIDVSQYGQIRYNHAGSTSSRSNVSGGVAFYDESKTFISGVQNKCNQSSTGYLSFTSVVHVPENAKYARFSIFTNTTTYGDFFAFGIPKQWLAIQDAELNTLIEKNKIGAVVWEDVKGTGTYTKYNGWEKGYWSSSNTQADSKYMMRYWTYFTSNAPLMSHARKLIFDVPDTYSLLLQGFGGDDYTTREEYYTIRGRECITLTDGLRYRMHLRQLDFDNMSTSGRGNDSILANLKIYPILEEVAPVVRPTSPGRRYFTVNINRAWANIAATSTSNAEGSDPVDIQCVIQLPTTYYPVGKKTPLIMYCHGASSNVTESKWYENSENFFALLDELNDAGFAVFDVANTRNQDGGFPDWGCLPLMEAYIKAWTYIKQNFNVEEKLYLLSSSMGTAANLNMMKWYGSDIIASLMTAPRPICKTRYEALTGDSKTNMAAAFGLSGTEWEDARLIGFQHYENIVEIDSTPRVLENFPPCKVMVGTSDTDFLTETRAYYSALANNGNYVNYREVSGADHSRMTFLSTSGLRAEAVAWFNRFKG